MPVGQHQHIRGGDARNTPPHTDRRGSVPGAGVFRLHQHGVVSAVIGALEQGDSRPAGVGPGHPDGVHGGLRTGIAEHHQLGAGDSLAAQFGQRRLVGGMDTELGSTGDRSGHRRHHRGVGVAENVATEPHGQVDVLVAVDVDDSGSGTLGDVHRIGHVHGADHLESDRLAGPLVQRARSRSAAEELSMGVGHGQVQG